MLLARPCGAETTPRRLLAVAAAHCAGRAFFCVFTQPILWLSAVFL